MFWKRRSLLLPLGASLVVAMFPGLRAAADEGEAMFLARYRCVLVEALQAIDATPKEGSEDQNRFFILDRLDHGVGYVQCVLIDYDAQILCEAASGFFEHDAAQPRAHFVVGDRLRALARLGFSLDDSKGNCVREFHVAGPDDFPRIADFALSALYEAYGLKPDALMRVLAPDAPEQTKGSHCSLVS